MKFLNPTKTVGLSLLLSFGGGMAHADACNTACTATEVAAQAACVLAIFDEPECSIAVAAAYAACQAACAATNNDVLTFLPSNTQADLMKSSISGSGLCNGSVPVKDEAKAKAFCEVFN